MYSPRGHSEESARSRAIVARLKRGDTELIARCASRIRTAAQAGAFPDFFGPDVTLVPVPGSSPLVRGALWIAFWIAESLVRIGLAKDTEQLVVRNLPVKKSAFQLPRDRPDVRQHYDSFFVMPVRPKPTGQLLLIDDVVTQGSTMLAAASRLAEAFPDAEIRGFAVVRTMSGVEITNILEPRVGTITPRGKRAFRRP